ncbi:MAG: DsbA family protein [Nitrosopumilus sp.]|nr:DsbA family protein [Nitrosopumilus sp.]MDH3737430.1 DsbA family protein [Nitrosopumilus sp.]MDH3824079.1 DsbA family protein [Nitrosopumilus sp.]MDH3834463.1 DsbA family protein [Nitrosopumilus sp.]
MIHGPSLAIGAVIASVVLVMVFLGFENFSDEPELVMEPTPTIQESGPPKITMTTFLENGSPMLGNPNAPVILVEFGDYQCHFCNVFFHSTEEDILNNYVETGKVRMIFKDYNIIGPDSVTASHGAHCANDQGLFWEYHDILYSNWTGENNGWASSENLAKFAQEVGLNIDDWSECMTKGVHSQTILASNNDARSLELTGTPAFFIIGPDDKVTRIFGAQPYEVFENIFEIELEK